MTDPADVRFFTALQQGLRELEGGADVEACRMAVERALDTGAPLDLRAARQQIDALAPALRDRLMAQVHARMASDLSAIWDSMPFAPRGQRPN